MVFFHQSKTLENQLMSDMFGRVGHQNRRKPNPHFGNLQILLKRKKLFKESLRGSQTLMRVLRGAAPKKHVYYTTSENCSE